MDFWGDRRGQPVQIGFILLFGILVLAFASYQGYVVPNQNGNIEVDHFETVSDQFAEFDTNLVNTVGNDVERSTAFDLGVQYPSRLIALNPPPVSGRLETTEPRRVSVVNDTGSDLTRSICGSDQATSRSLVYMPRYNEYREARSTTYENTVVTRSFRERDLHGDQRLVRSVDGGPDRIDLLLLNRSVSVDRQGTYSLKLEGSDRYSKRVENPNVTIATQFSSSKWADDILGDRSDVSTGNAGPDQVWLNFSGGTYEVSCAVVGLNDEPAFEPPASDSDDSSTFDTRWSEVLVEGSSRDLASQPVLVQPGDTVDMTMTVEGRESGLRIDEPLVGYTFSYDVENDGAYDFSRSPAEIDGGEDSISFTVPGSNQAKDGDTFEAFVTAGDDSDVVEFEVSITMADRFTVTNADGSNKPSAVEFTGENQGDSDVVITEIRVDGTDTSADIVDNDGSSEFSGDASYLNLTGGLEIGATETTSLETNAVIASGGSETFTLVEFRESDGSDLGNMNKQTVDLTLVFEDGSQVQVTLNT